MIVESACIPLPSEIIMTFSGYLVYIGKFGFWQVVFAGSLGNLVGAVLVYWIGITGGRDFVAKYGRYLLISRHDVEKADRFFNRYGDRTVLISRMLPIIRTFISLPAGIARMNFTKFALFSFIGSIPWCIMLAYVGFVLGEKWQSIEQYFRQFDILIGVVLIVALIYWLRGHFGKN